MSGLLLCACQPEPEPEPELEPRVVIDEAAPTIAQCQAHGDAAWSSREVPAPHSPAPLIVPIEEALPQTLVRPALRAILGAGRPENVDSLDPMPVSAQAAAAFAGPIRHALLDPERVAALYARHRPLMLVELERVEAPGDLAFVLREEVMPYFTAPVSEAVLAQNTARQKAYERYRAVSVEHPCFTLLDELLTLETRKLDALTPNAFVLQWMLRREAEGGPPLVAALGDILTDIDAQLPPTTIPASVWSEDTGELRRFTSPSNALTGYRSADGAVVIPAQFEAAEPFTEHGLADVRLVSQTLPASHFNGPLWRIGKSGEKIEEALYYDFGHDPYVEGLTRYVESDRIGFSTPTGEHVVAAQYGWANPFDYRTAIVCNGCSERIIYPEMPEHNTQRLGGVWGAIDATGAEVVAVTHTSSDAVLHQLGRRQGGLAIHQDGDRFGFSDATGAVVIPARYGLVRPFNDGRAMVCDGCTPMQDDDAVSEKWGIIDASGAVVVPLKYDSLSALWEAEGDHAR